MNSIDLSIIIVNYNGEHYLENCLKSIEKYCDAINFEIVIVDNNSSDNSVDVLKEKYPKITLIESKENLGFAGGNNLAVKRSKGKNILLLNNDTVLLEDIKPALATLGQRDVGVVGIKMLDGNKKYTPSVGRFPTVLKLLKFSFLEEKRPAFITGNFLENTIEVDWVTGAFLLTKRELWDNVNGLDETYFMYVEDVDFCKKISKLNKKVLFLSNLSYVHYVGFNSAREIKLIEGYKTYSTKHFNFVNSTLAKTSLAINYAYKKIFKNIC